MLLVELKNLGVTSPKYLGKDFILNMELIQEGTVKCFGVCMCWGQEGEVKGNCVSKYGYR